MDCIVELTGIDKSFGSTEVLRGVRLCVRRGETLAIVGPSGSGKSTLARLILGLDPPTGGQIVVDGVDVTDEGPRAEPRDGFSMVFQSGGLLDSMTVRDNVAFPLSPSTMTGLHEPEVGERVDRLLEALKLSHRADALPNALSGGEQKRVAIARALISEPEVIVYDEPTSGLDPDTRREIAAIMKQQQDERGVTSVMVTHDMATCLGIADRVVLLDGEGGIAERGEPSVLLEQDSKFRGVVDESAVSETKAALDDP